MDLYEACENGNEERVVELLVQGEEWIGARLAARDNVDDHSAPSRSSVCGLQIASGASKSSAFMAAAKAVVASVGLVRSPREMVLARGTAGRTPLHAACMGGQVSVVRLLLGEPCIVYFTSRTEQETVALLGPLLQEHEQLGAERSVAAVKGSRGASTNSHTIDGNSSNNSSNSAASQLFAVRMVTKDSEDDVVPVATVQFSPRRSVWTQDLLGGHRHVDDFGNTPLQCVSCFGCGSSERHIDDGLAITKLLLLHGDQPNVAKRTTQWTPLHWSAYNGNHEQAALLLDPAAFVDCDQHRLGKTQWSIPLLVTSDSLFAVDVAGRRGLALLAESRELQREQLECGATSAYARWRLRLSHVATLQVFVREFLEHAHALAQYVNEMNARLPLTAATRTKQRRFTRVDAVRYGQHLLYWTGCFGLVDDVRALLALRMDTVSSGDTAASGGVGLDPLYVCSCEEHKRQSVLHAVASHGQHAILALLLAKLLFDQQQRQQCVDRPVASSVPSQTGSAKTHRAWTSAVAPTPTAPIASALSSSETQSDTVAPAALNHGLDMLALVDCGWRNARNETPLFLAALHLQHRNVALCAQLLTPASVAYELAHANVEGTYIHHVADATAQRALGIAPSSNRSTGEYVLLFDGVRCKQFRDMVVETLCEESPRTPPLVVTRAGSRVHTLPWFAKLLLGHTRVQTDYVVVGATDTVLVLHAEALQLKVKHRGSTTRSPFRASAAAMFEPFRSLQRQQVVRDILNNNLDVAAHVHKQTLAALYPLHDASGCRSIMRQWVEDANGACVVQPFTNSSITQFLLERRTHEYAMLWPLLTYFGEKHAFYYAFVAFYSCWLLVIAIPGIVCELLLSVAGIAAPTPLFAVVVAMWATLVVERWKRKRSEIAARFGRFTRNRHERAPAFYGDFAVDDNAAGVDVTFPRAHQRVRIVCGVPILLTMATAVVAVFVTVKVTTVSTDVVARRAPLWLPPRLLPFAVPTANAVSMLVLDRVYTDVALALTQWENHRTVWQYESMLAAKLFAFKCLNAFLALFWVAFVDRDAVALRTQLVTAMGVRQLWYILARSIWPLLCVQQRWRANGFAFASRTGRTLIREWYTAELADSTTTTTTVPAYVLIQELMAPPDLLMTKQIELVLQFGYVSMFVSVLPAAPVLALVSNVVSTRLDVLCCVQVKQRPPFESETEVATFMHILEVMSFAAVAVNCAVLFFTTDQGLESVLALANTGVDNDSTRYVEKLWLLLAIEHVVLGAKALLSLAIDDAAAWVQHDDDRRDDAQQLQQRMAAAAPDSIDVNSDAVSTNGSHCQSYAQAARVDTAATLSATPAESPHHKVGAETDCFVDELIAEALDWAHGSGSGSSSDRTATQRARPDSSALNRVLADKYAAAVKERDDALQREQVAHEQLCACQQRLEQQHQQQQQVAASYAMNMPLTTAGPAMPMLKSASESDENLPPEHAVPPMGVSASSSKQHDESAATVADSTRTCLLCRLVRCARVAAVRRCLACRVFLCGPCDVTLHLDDLGVREPTHVRVNAVAHSACNDPLARSSSSDAAVCEPAASQLQLDELRSAVTDFVASFTDANGAPVADVARVLRVCAARPRLVIRYLRNDRRRRDLRR